MINHFLFLCVSNRFWRGIWISIFEFNLKYEFINSRTLSTIEHWTYYEWQIRWWTGFSINDLTEIEKKSTIKSKLIRKCGKIENSFKNLTGSDLRTNIRCIWITSIRIYELLAALFIKINVYHWEIFMPSSHCNLHLMPFIVFSF